MSAKYEPSIDLAQCFHFLSQYEWIHNFQVTSIFHDEIFLHLPDVWKSCLRQLSTTVLNEIPFLEKKSKEMYPEWPTDLHDFLSKSTELSFQRSVMLSSLGCGLTPISPEMARGMDSKKLHEVSHISSLIYQIAMESECNLIVDVGSGLGYLDHILHQVYGLRVLGLETCQSHSSASEVRAAKQGLDCGGVKSVQFSVENSSQCFSSLEKVIQENNVTLNCHHLIDKYRQKSPEEVKVCLIGLHCCGDLSSSMLSLFHRVTHVKALCYVSCCYHKMTFSEGRFKEFPLSEKGKRVYNEYLAAGREAFISPFTLRLGAQETRCRWRQQTEADHQAHTNHVAFRGLLSMTDENASAMRQKVRKCDFSDFECFVESFYSHISPQTEQVRKTSVLRELYETYKVDFDLIEVITLLQVIIQPVIETLVYQDRLQWLLEHGYFKAEIIPVFDEAISPRSLAIIAKKNGIS